MLAGAQSRKLLILLLLLVILTVTGTVAAVPFSTPMGGFWRDAQQFATTGHISSVFTPCGYPALLGLGFRAAGRTGIVAIQLLLYLLIVAAIYAILRLLGVDRSIAAMGAGLLGLHPELVISIKKIWDTNITTVLLLLLCAALLGVMRHGLTLVRAAVTGILWGLSINVRPNFPALILPIAFAFWFAAPATGKGVSNRGIQLKGEIPPTSDKKREIWATRPFLASSKSLLVSGAVTLFGAAFAVVLVSILVHGSFYVPQNGPYNFYAGDNSYTEMALVLALNAEPSIYPSLLAAGFPPYVDIYSPDLRPYYVEHALIYIRSHPLQAAELVLLKLETLLRPDTKIYPLPGLGGIVKVFLALAIPFWVVTLVVCRRFSWGREDWLFVTFLVAYVTPFLLTNSDPRFRIPLDVLLLTHATYRLAKLSSFQGQTAG
jgi:hypothetical protein